MKKRYVAKIYEVRDVKEYKDGGRDDIDEQTENQINYSTDFYCQIQGDSIRQIGEKIFSR